MKGCKELPHYAWETLHDWTGFVNWYDMISVWSRFLTIGISFLSKIWETIFWQRVHSHRRNKWSPIWNPTSLLSSMDYCSEIFPEFDTSERQYFDKGSIVIDEINEVQFETQLHFCHLWTIAQKFSLSLIHCVTKILTSCTSGILNNTHTCKKVWTVTTTQLKFAGSRQTLSTLKGCSSAQDWPISIL